MTPQEMDDIEETEEKKAITKAKKTGKINVTKIIGWIITILGFGFLFVKAFGDMVGFVISEVITGSPDYTYLIGLGLIVIGIVLMRYKRR